MASLPGLLAPILVACGREKSAPSEGTVGNLGSSIRPRFHLDHLFDSLLQGGGHLSRPKDGFDLQTGGQRPG